ncbi:MAG: hypothetical protein PUH92_07485 [Bacilli bacterium]|nr:hypothetical protein [Bacilli bacterium]
MTDKKRIVPLIVLPLLSLVSCGNQEMIDTIQVPSIYARVFEMSSRKFWR